MSEAVSPREAATALASDADMLRLLHGGELGAGLLGALRELRFPGNLALLPRSAEARAAWEGMAVAVRALPAAPDAAYCDDLAAEYAAIYLTGAYRASPCESFWLDQDHLLWQGPMFELRQRYAAAGLRVPDWRQRPDDHLVFQLGFIAHLLRSAGDATGWRAVAAFLDQHPLRWVLDFACAVFARSTVPFYAALAVLTASWCAELREWVSCQLGEPVPPPAPTAPAGAPA